MLKAAGFCSVTLIALYLAGVTPAGIKARIEAERQEHATIGALGDESSDWG